MASDEPNVLRHKGKGRYGICLAPGTFVGRDAPLLGRWAEELVMKNYREKTKATPATDWTDSEPLPVAGKKPNAMTNARSLYDFLRAHDPKLSAPEEAAKVADFFRAGKMKIPDIVTSKSSFKVYYEIKPGNTQGKKDGKEKLGFISTFMSNMKLSYVPGTSYSPGPGDDVNLNQFANPIFRLFAQRLGLKSIKVTFTFRRIKDVAGLILYWICLDIELEDDVDAEETVENMARWFVTHLVRLRRRGALVADLDIETVPADPSVQRLLPPAQRIVSAILTAPPAEEYMIVGGSLALDAVIEANKARMAATIGLMQVQQKGYVVRRWDNPSWLNRNIDKIVLVMKIGGTVAAVVVVVAVVGLATGGIGLAAGGGAVATGGTGAAGGAGATAAVGAVTPEIIAAPAAVEAVGGTGVLINAAGRFAAKAMADQAVKSVAPKVAAAAAGVVTTLFATRNAAAAAKGQMPPQFTEVETIRLIPLRDIVDPNAADTLSSVTLRDGTTGFNLGRVRVRNFEESRLLWEGGNPD